MIAAGTLSKRVTIVRLDLSEDGAGGADGTWRDQVTVWAEILPIRGSERIQSLAIEATVTHRVRIRKAAFPTLTAADRLREGARVFHLMSVIDYGERGEFLECLAEERTR